MADRLEEIGNIFTYYYFFQSNLIQKEEAATRGVLSKIVFLKILQNSQKNTCARVLFLIKLHALVLQLY